MMVQAEAHERIAQLRTSSERNQAAKEELTTQLCEQIQANKGARAQLEVAFASLDEAKEEVDEAYEEMDNAYASVNAIHMRVDRAYARMNAARVAMEHV